MGRTGVKPLQGKFFGEEITDPRVVHVAGYEAVADAARKNESEPPAHDLLVLPHRFQDRIRSGRKAGYVSNTRRKTNGPQVRLSPHGFLARAQSQPPRKAISAGDADGDCLSVDQAGGIV